MDLINICFAKDFALYISLAVLLNNTFTSSKAEQVFSTHHYPMWLYMDSYFNNMLAK